MGVLKKCLNVEFMILLCVACVAIVTLFYAGLSEIIEHERNRNFMVKLKGRLLVGNFIDSVCSDVIEGNETVLAKLERQPVETTDDEIKKRAKRGCWNVINYYSFNTSWSKLTADEKTHPIAYSILAHKNTEQLIQLLAAIYSPQNAYCVHIDKKSEEMMESFKLVQRCFSNVVLASKRVKVVYASISRLQADLYCMEDLLNSPVPWKHLINLCGQDFPIKTNVEIVRKLKQLKGRNLIAGHVQDSEGELIRTKFSHRLQNETNSDGSVDEQLLPTSTLKSKAPFNMTIMKNLAYNVYSRPFLHWVIFNSAKAKALFEWSKDTLTPDEHYWAMLDSLEEAPGRTGYSTINPLYPYILWKSSGNPCAGYWNHFNCVYGTGDVNMVIKREKLFANKFDISYDILPTICIRHWLNQREPRLTEG